MRVIFLLLVMMLIVEGAQAQSLKERLRQAREQEAELKKPTPTPVVSTTAQEPLALPQEKETECVKESKESGGVVYYNECYCKQLEYSQLDGKLKRHGILYQAQGIKELGDGTTHLNPADRVKHHYTCGVALSWDPGNAVKFASVDACYSFINTITKQIQKTTDVISEALNYGCGALVQKK